MIQWRVPSDLLSISVREMQPCGAHGNEGLALWFGQRTEEAVVAVTHVVAVHGSGFTTSPLHLRLSLRAMSTLIDLADSLDSYLAGQIHSHPGRYLDLSELDRDQGIQVPDYLSVVCPYYAQRHSTQLSDCGVHVFEQRAYRRLSATEVTARILQTNARAQFVRQEVHHD